MKRSSLIALATVVAAMTAGHAVAQSDDFGIWTEANVEKKVNKQLTIDGGIEMRTRDDVGEVDRWSAGIGATYKLTEWLKASAGYTFLYDNNEKWNDSGTKVARYWGERHRFNIGLTASYSFGNLSLSLRERWQYTYRPEKTVDRERVSTGAIEEKTYNGKGSNKWRNRLQLKYKLNKMWRPYANAESTVGGSGLDKMRYALGTEIRLSKQHWLDVKYLYQHSYKDDDDEGNRHVIGIGYTYKF